MYQWLVFLHVAAVLAFLIAHGAHVTVMWAWRREPDPASGMTLFNGVPDVLLTRLLLAIVIASGAVAAVVGSWWQHAWPWLSLGLLVAIWAAMYRWGGGFFNAIEAAAERAIEERDSDSGATTAMETYRQTRLGWQPVGMMVIGLGGLAGILWLMMFKPF